MLVDPEQVERFREVLVDLQLEPKTISQVVAMVIRFRERYTWVSLSELFSFVIPKIPEARTRWEVDEADEGKHGKWANFGTYLISAMRNAILSHIRAESLQRRHVAVYGSETMEVFAERSDAEVERRDRLQLLCLVLSPLAWRVLMMNLDSAPNLVTRNHLRAALQISERAVVMVQHEVQSTCRLVLGLDRRFVDVDANVN